MTAAWWAAKVVMVLVACAALLLCLGALLRSPIDHPDIPANRFEAQRWDAILGAILMLVVIVFLVRP